MVSRALLLLCLGLCACSGEEDIAQFVSDPVRVEGRYRTPYERIEVTEVTLPTYAAAQEIAVRRVDGTVRASPNNLWAEEPERALTNALVRYLQALTRADIAADPWPLGGSPEVEITVRVERLLVTEGGGLEFSGQFAVGVLDGPGDGRLRQFDIKVPLRGPTYADIGVAHEAAYARLAEQIAKALR